LGLLQEKGQVSFLYHLVSSVRPSLIVKLYFIFHFSAKQLNQIEPNKAGIGNYEEEIQNLYRGLL